MAVTKNGKCSLQLNERAGMVLNEFNSSYTLPIGAVDTHRPKPKAAVQPSVVPALQREYYADQK